MTTVVESEKFPFEVLRSSYAYAPYSEFKDAIALAAENGCTQVYLDPRRDRTDLHFLFANQANAAQFKLLAT